VFFFKKKLRSKIDKDYFGNKKKIIKKRKKPCGETLCNPQCFKEKNYKAKK